MPNSQPLLLKTLESLFIKRIDCGDFHSLALENIGNVYSWGIGMQGECGHGIFKDAETPTRIKYLEGKNVVHLVAGNHHSLALTSNNEIYSWG